MKTSIHKQAALQGSVLIATLIICLILVVAMASYLMLISTQKKLVVRSETWNAAMTFAEAGAEEALAQINNSTANLAANGWSGPSGAVFGPKSNNLVGGSYSVIISNGQNSATTLNPVIYTTGYAKVPVTGENISRKVRVTTQYRSTINLALGVRKDIDFKGNGVAVASWNSNISTNGYSSGVALSTNANVASVKGVVDLGQHDIWGNLYLGPTATFSSSSNGVTGTIYHDFNQDFASVTVPATNWTQVASITTNTTSGYYQINSGTPTIEVKPGVTVNIQVVGITEFDPTILIHGGNTNSGKAIIYLNGPSSLKLNGNTAIDPSYRPGNLYYYGTSNLTSVTYGGNSSFNGVLYAPDADLTMNGGGGALNYIGSIIASSIKMNGKYNIYFDEALTNSPATLVISSWQEL